MLEFDHFQRNSMAFSKPHVMTVDLHHFLDIQLMGDAVVCVVYEVDGRFLDLFCFENGVSYGGRTVSSDDD